MFYKIFVILTMTYIVSGADDNDDMVNSDNKFLINSSYIANEENKLYDTNTQYLDRLCWSAQKMVNSKTTNYKIYAQIIEAFIEKYIKRHQIYDKTVIEVDYNVPMDFKPEDIYELCSEIEKKHTNIDDYDYFCLYKTLFIESALFSLNTIKEISNMHKKLKKDKIRFKNKIYNDVALLERFIISINWLNSILFMKNVINLLDIFDEFNIYHNEATKTYCFSYKYQIKSLHLPLYMTMNGLVECIKPYFIKNNFTSKQNILKNTCSQKINEWIDVNCKFDEADAKELYKKAFHCITLYRSMQTKIDYLSKYSYAPEGYRRSGKYNMTDEQKVFIEKLRLDTVVKDIYNAKFYTLRMHSDKIIMKIFDLIPTFEKNIHQLIMYKEHSIKFLSNEMKTYFKKLIKKYFKDKRSNNISRKEKKECMSEIKKIMVNTEFLTQSNTTDQRKIFEKNIYKVFYDTFLSNAYIYNFNQKYSNLIVQTINCIYGKTINNNIDQLYSELNILMIEIIDMKKEVDKKREESKSIYKHLSISVSEKFRLRAVIQENTLCGLADGIFENHSDGYRDTIMIYCDEILKIKLKIYKAEELIFEILKKIKEEQIKLLKTKKTTLQCVIL